jgi:hypothetical protein
MTVESKKEPFHWRGLTSLITFSCFTLLTVTGIVLYISPKGRVANWTGWSVLGLTKEEWSAVHMVVAFAFIIAAGFHLYFNWTVFWNYFKSKLVAGLHLKREIAAALVVTVLLVAGTVANLPPFSSFIQLNDAAKAYWETRSLAGPYPHAEDDSLAVLAERTGVPLETMISKLRASGFEVDDPSVKLSVLAEKHGKTPSQVFAALREKGQGTPEASGGPGYGRMTLEQVCRDLGIEVEEAVAALRQSGIDAAPTDIMRSLADTAGKTPHDLLEMIKP